MNTHVFVLLDGPYQSSAAATLLSDMHAVIARGDDVSGVFLAMEGVGLVAAHKGMHGDGTLAHAYVDYAAQHDIPLLACVGAALRRGVIAQKHNNTDDTLQGGFAVSGLLRLFLLAKAADTVHIYGRFVHGTCPAGARQRWIFRFRGDPYDGIWLQELYDFALAAACVGCTVTFDIGALSRPVLDNPPHAGKNIYKMLKTAGMYHIDLYAPNAFPKNTVSRPIYDNSTTVTIDLDRCGKDTAAQ